MTEAARQREPEPEPAQEPTPGPKPANGSDPVRVIVWYDYI